MSEAEADKRMRFVLALRQGGVTDARVLSAMERTPRTHFAPPQFAAFAWEDRELPLDADQVMTAPSIVARMVMALQLAGHETVLEIGTGSGFQAAALGVLARRVISLERIQSLAAAARGRIGEMRLMHVHVHFADGFAGWPQDVLFDRVVINAEVETPPWPVIDQLAVGGLLVAPIGGRLHILRKDMDGHVILERDAGAVRLAPLAPGRVEKSSL